MIYDLCHFMPCHCKSFEVNFKTLAWKQDKFTLQAAELPQHTSGAQFRLNLYQFSPHSPLYFNVMYKIFYFFFTVCLVRITHQQKDLHLPLFPCIPHPSNPGWLFPYSILGVISRRLSEAEDAAPFSSTSNHSLLSVLHNQLAVQILLFLASPNWCHILLWRYGMRSVFKYYSVKNY